MKYALILVLCVLASGCNTTRQRPPRVVLHDIDSVLGREHRAREFERRLDELGAQTRRGSVPEELVATIAIPGKPGYFPPRTVEIVYVITDKGLVVLRTVDVTSLGSRFAGSISSDAPTHSLAWSPEGSAGCTTA
jgi:hypothetical protein